MEYWYDTEFKEDGKIIDLISIGMVAEDGREYYAVSSEFNTQAVAADDWLMKNVMSSIDHEVTMTPDFSSPGLPMVKDLFITDPAAKSRDEIRDDLYYFIRPGAELWAWYGAYDHVALCQLWGKMIDLPAHIPMYTNDIKTLVKNRFVKGPQQPEGLHNALADARFNIVRHNYFLQDS